jgi:hypothetical protein
VWHEELMTMLGNHFRYCRISQEIPNQKRTRQAGAADQCGNHGLIFSSARESYWLRKSVERR